MIFKLIFDEIVQNLRQGPGPPSKLPIWATPDLVVQSLGQQDTDLGRRQVLAAAAGHDSDFPLPWILGGGWPDVGPDTHEGRRTHSALFFEAQASRRGPASDTAVLIDRNEADRVWYVVCESLVVYFWKERVWWVTMADVGKVECDGRRWEYMV
jgi:hypothetical protein